MRPAEILVKLLLSEALPKTIAVAWGPGMPKEGKYAGAGNEARLYRKFKEYLGGAGIRGANPEHMMSVWLLRGFSILLRHEDGSIAFYGPAKSAAIDQRIVLIYGLQSGTPVTHYTRKPAGGLNKTTSTAAAVLGIE